MCSFLIFLNKLLKNNNLKEVNKLLKLRGPDNTNIVDYENYTFIHNLLHICGDKTIQPFINNNIVCLFNGEIYNYKDFNSEYKSDGECLIDLYLKYGQEFVKKLDGEFAIVLFDFNKEEVIISSDIFATKPLFYSFNDGFIISSFKSVISKNFDTIDIIKLPANTCIKFNFNFNIINTKLYMILN